MERETSSNIAANTNEYLFSVELGKVGDCIEAICNQYGFYQGIHCIPAKGMVTIGISSYTGNTENNILMCQLYLLKKRSWPC